MKHGSLFSGIGGFDLAASWMGWDNVFYCEKDPFCGRVLKYYWPISEGYEDIRAFSAVKYRGAIDVLSGGFPCQPFSIAGRRKGTEDDRYLWPEMCRIIGEVRPRWVVGENVPGLLNWSGGMVFEQVQADLEAAGYTVWPCLLPASGLGAPHKRERVWFIAHADQLSMGEQERGVQAKGTGKDKEAHPHAGKPGRTDTDDPERGNTLADIFPGPAAVRGWRDWPSESPVCRRNDGVFAGLDGIAFSTWREESLKALGNAIVPQVALQIFRVIKLLEEEGLERSEQ